MKMSNWGEKRNLYLLFWVLMVVPLLAYADSGKGQWELGQSAEFAFEIFPKDSAGRDNVPVLRFSYQVELEKDQEFGGKIDGFQWLPSPANFNEKHIPWLAATWAIEELLANRIFLKEQFFAMGESGLDYRAPAVLNVRFPERQFSYFKDYCQRLDEPELPLNDMQDDELAVVELAAREQLKNRMYWLILGYGQQLYQRDIKVGNAMRALAGALASPGEIAGRWELSQTALREMKTVLADRARISAFAPRLLEVGVTGDSKVGERTLLTYLAEDIFSDEESLPSWFREELPNFENYLENDDAFPEIPKEVQLYLEIADRHIRNHLRMSLNQNRVAIETYASALSADELMDLAFLEPLRIRIESAYPEHKETISKAWDTWKERAEQKLKKDQRNHHIIQIAGFGVWLASLRLPTKVPVPPWLMTLGEFAGSSILFTEAWVHFWGERAKWNRKRALFIGSPYLIHPSHFTAAMGDFERAKAWDTFKMWTFLPLGIGFFGRSMVYWRHPSQSMLPNFLFKRDFWGTSPQGHAKILQELDTWLIDGVSRIPQNRTPQALARTLLRMRTFLRSDRAARMLARHEEAVRRIVRHERALNGIIQRNPGSVLADDAVKALERRPLQLVGRRFHWADDFENVLAAEAASIPPISWRFWRAPEEVMLSLRDLQQFMTMWHSTVAKGKGLVAGTKALAGSAASGTYGAVKGAVTNPWNLQMAWAVTSSAMLTAWFTETFNRDGDVWEDDQLFGQIERPASGTMITLSFTGVVLLTKSFISYIPRPATRAFVGAIPAVGGSYLAQKHFSPNNEADIWRTLFDGGFDTISTLALFPAQLKFGVWASNRLRGMGPGLHYFGFRGALAGAGVGVMLMYTNGAYYFFEADRGALDDGFGNYYRRRDDNEPFYQPPGGYGRPWNIEVLRDRFLDSALDRRMK